MISSLWDSNIVLKKIGPARWRKNGLKTLLQGADADQRCHSSFDYVLMGLCPRRDGLCQELDGIDCVRRPEPSFYSYSPCLFFRHAGRVGFWERLR